jgi:hypothetical protein
MTGSAFIFEFKVFCVDFQLLDLKVIGVSSLLKYSCDRMEDPSLPTYRQPCHAALPGRHRPGRCAVGDAP